MTDDHDYAFDLGPEAGRFLQWSKRRQDLGQQFLRSINEERERTVREQVEALSSWDEELRRQTRAARVALAVGPILKRIDAIVDELDCGAAIERRRLEHIVHELSGVANEFSIDTPLPELVSDFDRGFLIALARWCRRVIRKDEPPHYSIDQVEIDHHGGGVQAPETAGLQSPRERDLILNIDTATQSITYGDSRVGVVETVECGSSKWALLLMLLKVRGSAASILDVASGVDIILAKLEEGRVRLEQNRPSANEDDALLDGDERVLGSQLKRRGPRPSGYSTKPVAKARQSLMQVLRNGAPKGGATWRRLWIRWDDDDVFFDC